MTQQELANLVGAMFDTIADALLDNMSAGHGFTCAEAEAIAEVMQATERPTLAVTFMICHAATDDDDHDRHKVVTDDTGCAIGWTNK
jgi:hypothetical protein